MEQLLILFDIDGTIIYHVDKPVNRKDRFLTALEEIYGVTYTGDINQYMGVTDREMAWSMLKDKGITKDEFVSKFPAYISCMKRCLVDGSLDGPLYVAITDAKRLVEKLSREGNHILGLLTGNSKPIADWKMDHTGYQGLFTFGLYGGDADSRVELAKRVFEQTKVELGHEFTGEKIIVIGDTVHDIECGEAIGATTIGVTTGYHTTEQELLDKGADLVVESLMDPKVLALLSTASGEHP